MKKENLFEPNCIRTFTGRYVNIFEPTPEMFCIEDIAHSLSHQCRFGGHLPQFYSVAEHSIRCSNLFQAPELQLEALLHDASEAYLMDLPRPIKNNMPLYKTIEDNIMGIIGEKFGFIYPLSEMVRQADETMLQREWNELMLGNGFLISYGSPSQVKGLFLQTFHSLYNPEA